MTDGLYIYCSKTLPVKMFLNLLAATIIFTSAHCQWQWLNPPYNMVRVTVSARFPIHTISPTPGWLIFRPGVEVC